MKNALPFLVFISIFLAACNSAAKDTSATEPTSPSQTVAPESRPVEIPTVTKSATLSSTGTSTLTPSPTGTSTASPSPTITLPPSATQTFDVSNALIRTPGSPARCPPENPALVPAFEIPPKFCLDTGSQVVDFLNAGGQAQRVVDEMTDSASLVDLTNDGIPELTNAECNFRVYSCQDGQYQTILDMGDKEGFSDILAVEDMNLNGVPELIIGGGVWPYSNAPIIYYRILEWDGQQFKNLVSHPDFRSRYGGGGIHGGWIYSEGYADPGDFMQSTMSVRDIDGNGTKELVLKCGWPTSLDWSINGGPTRGETHTYMWNGSEYNLENIQVSPPEYRFQAVQDADYASLDSDYLKALDLYLQVIFSDDLDWWSKEKAEHTILLLSQSVQGLTTPTPLPTDTSERSILAAYAYYRMMLIHILIGNRLEAENIFNTLMNNYKVGEAGYAFVELATSFWTEYVLSQDIHQACSKAVKYAEEHKTATIDYLGSNYHGWQSHQYQPEDICPFMK